MKRARQQASGFSLLELMIVIGVFGILLAITVPAMSRYLRTARLTGATNTLMADLHYARALANSQRKTFEILFQSGRYQIVRVSPPATIITRVLPRGVACAASDTATFYAWGLTDPVTVTMTNSGASSVVRLAANGGVAHD